MKKKTDIVREALELRDYKTALRIAKGFRMVTKEEKDAMTRGYECLIHPEFYKQLGYDVDAELEKAKKVVDKWRTNKNTGA